MAPFTAVSTDKAYNPLPQYSQAVVINGVIHTSGTIGWEPSTSKMVEGGIKEQTRMTLGNIKAILEAAGSSLRNIYKCNCYLVTMADFNGMNEVWDEVFPEEVKMARATVSVAQNPMGALILIECQATLN